MYKIGVVGAGHLGKIHIKILKEADFIELVGFFDINEQVRNQVSEEYGVRHLKNTKLLFNLVTL